MAISIKNVSEENNKFTFTLSNVNVSIANGLRRIIMSEIDCLVFKTFPYKDNLTTIHKNTSRLHNEIIKQRLSCVPVHIKDIDTFPTENYIIVVDIKNEGDTIIVVTTEDFKIMNVETKEYISDAERNKIFPPDPFTGEYIDLVKLRPKLSDTLLGEEIHFESKLTKGNSKEDGAFNVISTCFYEFTPDQEKIRIERTTQLKKLKDLELDEEEINYRIKDWELLDSKRLFLKDSFDFTIETIGQFTNVELIITACDIMIQKLNKFKVDIENDSLIETSKTTIPNCYDIKLINEDYTLGKVIEYMLYTYYENEKISYCGFSKPHPHISESIVRVAFHGEVNTEIIQGLMKEVSDKSIIIFENLKGLF